ncbi:hypothetical protein B566_EDAN009072 [Ephemera danica]|nr:hypothetical protein B566_EDAN009072 [Ephemera danica]
MTSKCHNLNELQGQLDKFGYRGEAIASLREVSSLLTIASRAKGSQETYSKVFAHGKSTSVGLTSEQRPCHGTTVTALDFLYNMPVRRKRIKETLDFEEMKLQLESLAMMYPNVSISLRNEATKKLLLQTRKCASTVEVFRNFYGSSLANSLCPLHHVDNNMEITGFIGKEVHPHKTLQFLYINNRLVVKTKLHKLVNMILAKSFLLRSNGPWMQLPIPKDMNEKFGMPITKKSKHGIFIINIHCPYTEYDITLDPKKTQVQFKNWSDVLQCLENAVKKFLESENLTVPASSPTNSTQAEESSTSSTEEEEVQDETSKEGGATKTTKRKHFPTPQLHIARAVHGLPAKRPKCNVKSIWPQAELDTDTTISDTPETTSDKESAKEVTLSSEESGTEIEDPIPKTLKKMEMKNLGKEPVKSKSKKSKKGKIQEKKQKPSTSQAGQRLLPDHFNQLQIYSLASNTLKKSFGHKTTSYLNKAEKSDPKFPIFNKIARDYLKTKSLADQACQTSNTPYIEESSNHEIECLPDDMPNVTEMQHLDVDDVQISDPPPEPIISHQTTECNQYVQQQQHTDLPPFVLQTTRTNQNPEDQENNLFSQMLQNNQVPIHQSGSSNVATNSNYHVPEYSTISHGSTQSDILNVSKHHEGDTILHSNCHCCQQINPSVQYESVQPNAKKQSKCRSTKKMSEIYLSSESSSSSESNDDCLSEESFKKLEAKLYGPLEDISKEINDARHSLLEDSPIVSPAKLSRNVMESPFFTSNKSPLPKFQKLLQFSYKRRPCYTPSFQTPKAKTVKYNEKISGDSPFSRLDRHVAELENLTKLDIEPGVGPYSEASKFVQTRGQMLQQTHSITLSNQDHNIVVSTQPKNCCPAHGISQQPLPLVTNSSFLSTAEILQTINQPSISETEDNSMLTCSAILENISGEIAECTAHSSQSKMYTDLSRSQSGQQDILPSNCRLPESSYYQTGSDVFMEVDRSPILQYSIESTTQLQTQPVLVNTTDPSRNYSPYHRRSHLVPYSSSSSSEDTEIKVVNTSWNSILNSDDMESDQANCLQQLFSSNVNNICLQPYEEPISSNSDGNALAVFKNNTDVENNSQNFPLGGSSIIPPSIQIDDVTMESRNHKSGMTEISNEENSTIPLEIEDTEKLEPPLTVSDISDDRIEDEWQERVDPSGRKYYFNRKTSITTYEVPVMPQCSFSMTPRHAFMPKGTSPVLAIPSGSSGSRAESLSAEEQAKLQQALEESSSLEQHLANVKWSHLTDGKPSGAIRNACEHNDAIVKTYQVLHNFKFSKDMFENFKVLGQWDNKFILTVMRVPNEQEPHLLVLFDQHAVHERVRLERLTTEYQSDSETCEFRSEEICPTLLLRLSEREVCVMLSFQEKFQKLGLKFKILNNRKVLVSHVPTCLKLRSERQRSSQRQCLEDMVTSLVGEQVHLLLQTRGVGARVPPTLQSILNSEACTGAVKFGDPLSTSECHMLLSCLRKCSVPFQCAHGRPVLAPLADLRHMDRSQQKSTEM